VKGHASGFTGRRKGTRVAVVAAYDMQSLFLVFLFVRKQKAGVEDFTFDSSVG
jgi:hypothetical protein